MAEIKFNDGVEEININGKVSISINPTDINFSEKLFNVFDALDEKQTARSEEIQGKSGREIFDISRKLDNEMRELVNSAFGFDICKPLFGSMHLYSHADGLPVWCNLLLAIIDMMDTAVTEQQKMTNPRVQKYLAKYKK